MEALSTRLSNHFSRSDAFRVGLAITNFLQHPDLLPLPQQRLAALVFLHDLFRNETFNLNPFLSVFVHFLYYEEEGEDGGSDEDGGEKNLLSFSRPLKGVQLSLVEKQFVTLLVTGAAKEWVKKTPRQICQSDPVKNFQNVDLTGIQLALAERDSELPHSARSGASVVVPDPDRFAPPTQQQQQPVLPPGQERQRELKAKEARIREVMEGLLLGGDESPVGQSLNPELVRPAPPLFLDEEEVAWINPVDFSHLDFAYDKTMCEANASANEAKRYRNEKKKKKRLDFSALHCASHIFQDDCQSVQAALDTVPDAAAEVRPGEGPQPRLLHRSHPCAVAQSGGQKPSHCH